MVPQRQRGALLTECRALLLLGTNFGVQKKKNPRHSAAKAPQRHEGALVTECRAFFFWRDIFVKKTRHIIPQEVPQRQRGAFLAECRALFLLGTNFGVQKKEDAQHSAAKAPRRR